MGNHLLTVEFVNNNGSSYNPELIQTISFSVVKKTVVKEKAGKDYTILIKDNKFNPTTLIITKKDKIIFRNNAKMPHTIKIISSNKDKGNDGFSKIFSIIALTNF